MNKVISFLFVLFCSFSAFCDERFNFANFPSNSQITQISVSRPIYYQSIYDVTNAPPRAYQLVFFSFSGLRSNETFVIESSYDSKHWYEKAILRADDFGQKKLSLIEDFVEHRFYRVKRSDLTNFLTPT